jgi:hypothetical protein
MLYSITSGMNKVWYKSLCWPQMPS